MYHHVQLRTHFEDHKALEELLLKWGNQQCQSGETGYPKPIHFTKNTQTKLTTLCFEINNV